MKNKLNAALAWLLPLYVFLLPWQTSYILSERSINGAKSQFLSGQIFATEILLWLIVMLYALTAIRLKPLSLPAVNRAGKRLFFIVCLWLFLAWCGLTIIWSADRSAAYLLWLHALEAGALLLLLSAGITDRLKLLWTLLISAAIQGALAVQQFISQSIDANKWLGIANHAAAHLGDAAIEASGGRWLRAYGAFSHPNALGGFLAFGLTAGLLLWLNYFSWPIIAAKRTGPPWTESETKKFIGIWLKILTVLPLTLLCGAGLFFSFSRSAWLAALLCLICFLAITRRHWLKRQAPRQALQFLTLPIGLLLLFASYFFIFNPMVLSRTDLTNKLEARSETERLNQLPEAWEVIAAQPLGGTGIGNYTVALSRQFPARDAYSLQPVHNIFILVWAELGLLGLALFIALLTGAWRLSPTAVGRLPLLALLIIGCFDHYLSSQYAGIVMLAIALTFSINNDNFETQKPNEH